MACKVGFGFGGELERLPPIVQRIILDLVPAEVLRQVLDTEPGDVELENPQLAGAAILGRLAELGELPGPPALATAAQGFLRALQATLTALVALEGRLPRVKERAQRRAVAVSLASARALIAATEAVFPEA
jgi:hypothetical protein